MKQPSDMCALAASEGNIADITFMMIARKESLQLRLEEQVQCMGSAFSDGSFQIIIAYD